MAVFCVTVDLPVELGVLPGELAPLLTPKPGGAPIGRFGFGFGFGFRLTGTVTGVVLPVLVPLVRIGDAKFEEPKLNELELKSGVLGDSEPKSKEDEGEDTTPEPKEPKEPKPEPTGLAIGGALNVEDANGGSKFPEPELEIPVPVVLPTAGKLPKPVPTAGKLPKPVLVLTTGKLLSTKLEPLVLPVIPVLVPMKLAPNGL